MAALHRKHDYRAIALLVRLSNHVKPTYSRLMSPQKDGNQANTTACKFPTMFSQPEKWPAPGGGVMERIIHRG